MKEGMLEEQGEKYIIPFTFCLVLGSPQVYTKYNWTKGYKLTGQLMHGQFCRHHHLSSALSGLNFWWNCVWKRSKQSAVNGKTRWFSRTKCQQRCEGTLEDRFSQQGGDIHLSRHSTDFVTQLYWCLLSGKVDMGWLLHFNNAANDMQEEEGRHSIFSLCREQNKLIRFYFLASH